MSIYATVKTADGPSAAVRDADGPWRRLPAADLSELFTLGPLGSHDAGEALPDAQPGLPLPRPAKVICCGLNYADHITEMGRDLPTRPTLFTKFADTLCGPTDEIEVPDGLGLDWEAELAVVIGTPVRGADRDTAATAIAGYTVANDISMRTWQHHTAQWLPGKAWDATTPLGPVIVAAADLEVAAGLMVTCRVNGETVQKGSTAQLVFDPADLVAYISTFTTLRPGDVVLTGTPGGVGAGRTPPVYLAYGDVVETEIEGIGALRNLIRVTRGEQR